MTRDHVREDGMDSAPDPEMVERLNRAAEGTRQRLIDEAQGQRNPRLEQASAKHWVELMRNEQAPSAGPDPSGTWLPQALKLAAALLLLASGWWFSQRGLGASNGSAVGAGGGAPSEAPPLVLDAGPELRLLSPIGDVENYTRFHWSSQLAPGGWYELRIWDGETEDGQPLLQTEVDDPEWIPKAEWQPPPSLRWQVREFSPDGTLGAVLGAQARRVPR